MKLNSIALNEGVLNEGGLSRIVMHIKDRPFAVLTAFRANFSLSQNRLRNKDLEASLRAIDAGGIKLIGHWLEAPDGQWFGRNLAEIDPAHLDDAIEESYFVPMPDSLELSEFRSWVVQTIRHFNQDAAVFGFDSGVYLIDKADELVKIGNRITVGKIAQAYSTLGSRNFIFEGSMGPSNNAHRVLLQKRGVIWV